MSNEVLKIGMIGSRPYAIGGHDIHDDLRKQIIIKISGTLSELQSSYKVLLGLTGLSLGSEIDFAEACTNANIDYIIYQPFTDPERYWHQLPESILNNYSGLLSGALSVTQIGEGGFSPKKNHQKNLRIIGDSDLVLLVNNKFNELKTATLVQYMNNISKPFIKL